MHLRPRLTQVFSIRRACVCFGGTAFLFLLCGAITVSHLCLENPFSFLASLPLPNPIAHSCAHIPARLHARTVKWDTGEDRREELFEADLRFHDIWAPPSPVCCQSLTLQHWATGGQLSLCDITQDPKTQVLGHHYIGKKMWDVFGTSEQLLLILFWSQRRNWGPPVFLCAHSSQIKKKKNHLISSIIVLIKVLVSFLLL